ncbi:hypothetical protein GVAV_002157 [Gurleya vavrai]
MNKFLLLLILSSKVDCIAKVQQLENDADKVEKLHKDSNVKQIEEMNLESIFTFAESFINNTNFKFDLKLKPIEFYYYIIDKDAKYQINKELYENIRNCENKITTLRAYFNVTYTVKDCGTEDRDLCLRNTIIARFYHLIHFFIYQKIFFINLDELEDFETKMHNKICIEILFGFDNHREYHDIIYVIENSLNQLDILKNFKFKSYQDVEEIFKFLKKKYLNSFYKIAIFRMILTNCKKNIIKSENNHTDQSNNSDSKSDINKDVLKENGTSLKNKLEINHTDQSNKSDSESGINKDDLKGNGTSLKNKSEINHTDQSNKSDSKSDINKDDLKGNGTSLKNISENNHTDQSNNSDSKSDINKDDLKINGTSLKINLEKSMEFGDFLDLIVTNNKFGNENFFIFDKIINIKIICYDHGTTGYFFDLNCTDFFLEIFFYNIKKLNSELIKNPIDYDSIIDCYNMNRIFMSVLKADLEFLQHSDLNERANSFGRNSNKNLCYLYYDFESTPELKFEKHFENIADENIKENFKKTVTVNLKPLCELFNIFENLILKNCERFFESKSTKNLFSEYNNMSQTKNIAKQEERRNCKTINIKDFLKRTVEYNEFKNYEKIYDYLFLTIIEDKLENEGIEKVIEMINENFDNQNDHKFSYNSVAEAKIEFDNFCKKTEIAQEEYLLDENKSKLDSSNITSNIVTEISDKKPNISKKDTENVKKELHGSKRYKHKLTSKITAKKQVSHVSHAEDKGIAKDSDDTKQSAKILPTLSLKNKVEQRIFDIASTDNEIPVDVQSNSSKNFILKNIDQEEEEASSIDLRSTINNPFEVEDTKKSKSKAPKQMIHGRNLSDRLNQPLINKKSRSRHKEKEQAKNLSISKTLSKDSDSPNNLGSNPNVESLIDETIQPNPLHWKSKTEIVEDTTKYLDAKIYLDKTVIDIKETEKDFKPLSPIIDLIENELDDKKTIFNSSEPDMISKTQIHQLKDQTKKEKIIKGSNDGQANNSNLPQNKNFEDLNTLTNTYLYLNNKFKSHFLEQLIYERLGEFQLNYNHQYYIFEFENYIGHDYSLNFDFHYNCTICFPEPTFPKETSNAISNKQVLICHDITNHLTFSNQFKSNNNFPFSVTDNKTLLELKVVPTATNFQMKSNGNGSFYHEPVSALYTLNHLNMNIYQMFPFNSFSKYSTYEETNCIRFLIEFTKPKDIKICCSYHYKNKGGLCHYDPFILSNQWETSSVIFIVPQFKK